VKTGVQQGLLGGSVSRRKFLGKTATAAIGFTIVPRHVLGGVKYVSPSDKVNIAFIGVGSQGFRVMLKFLQEPDVQGIAVCDPDQGSANHPEWDTHEFCNSVRQLLGVNSGWDWLSPDNPIQLTHSLQVTSGVSGREPCQKIVNAYYGAQQRSGQYRGCSAYNDFRDLLEKEKDIDAVVVCTTDNLHAAVSAAAMKAGKHVFCQKPLTHTIYEARRIAEIARETGVATQIAMRTRLLRTRDCCASGSGQEQSDQSAKFRIGQAVRFGRKGWNARKTPSRSRRVWTGTSGLGLRRSAPSITLICPLFGEAGQISDAGRLAIWVLTVSIRFSAY
jgi:hypothetical protein